MAPRVRFCGDDKELGAVLLWYYRTPYDVPAIIGAKNKHCIKHMDLLLELQSLQPNLSFKASTVSSALTTVLEAHPNWDIRVDEKEAWVSDNTKRSRSLCRFVAQAKIKSPRAAWLQSFKAMVPDIATDDVVFIDPPAAQPLQDDDAQDAQPAPLADDEQADDDAVDLTQHDAQQYSTGWDDEHQAAWRLPRDQQSKLGAQWTQDLVPPTSGEGCDPMIARWPDGFASTPSCQLSHSTTGK